MEKGQELLLGVFDQLRDSCFFVGNQQWEWEAEIRAALEKIQTDDYEIEYKKHLQFIKTNNRLLHTLPIVDILDISEVLQNSHEIGGIDLVITNRPYSGILPEDTEIVEFDKFRKSQFSKTLRDMPSDGVKDFEIGEYDNPQKFYDEFYLKPFRYAKKFEICDKLLGKLWPKTNYGTNLKWILEWLDKSLRDEYGGDIETEIVIHTQKLDSKLRPTLLEDYVENEIRLDRIKADIKYMYYELPDSDQVLPHERFILTDQIALQIGRGVDQFSVSGESKGSNRDIFLVRMDPRQCAKVIGRYKDGNLPNY